MFQSQTPVELLRARGIDYHSLPSTPPRNTVGFFGRAVEKLGSTLWNMTVILPLLIFAHEASYLNRPVRSESEWNLTEGGHQRLRALELKIRKIAQEIGIADASKIRAVYLGEMSQAEAYALTLLIHPALLIKPEDLPQHLQLTDLDCGKMTEEEWVCEFYKWVREDTFRDSDSRFNQKVPESQLQIDEEIEYGKIYLKMLKNKRTQELVLDGILKHELGHISHGHSLKKLYVSLGLRLLALPTLGLSAFFEDELWIRYRRNLENEADIFCSNYGGSEGLISFLESSAECGKNLFEKYPQFYCKSGDIVVNSHPPIHERVSSIKCNDENKLLEQKFFEGFLSVFDSYKEFYEFFNR